jgi:hypothetical protein
MCNAHREGRVRDVTERKATLESTVSGCLAEVGTGKM